MVVTSYGRNKNHEYEIKNIRLIKAPAIAVRLIIKLKQPHVNKKTTRECEVLFKHRFLTLLKN